MSDDEPTSAVDDEALDLLEAVVISRWTNWGGRYTVATSIDRDIAALLARRRPERWELTPFGLHRRIVDERAP